MIEDSNLGRQFDALRPNEFLGVARTMQRFRSALAATFVSHFEHQRGHVPPKRS